MNILFLTGNFFGIEPSIMAFTRLGHKVFRFAHDDYQERKSPKFEEDFTAFVKQNEIDICFSYNYHPIMAESAKNNGIKYISIVYDSPFVPLFSFTVIYPTNYIFVFDYDLCARLNKEGIMTVYYMPLASDTVYIEGQVPEKNRADVSFVGSLYNETHTLYDRLGDGISQRTRGYLEGIMAAQMNVYGDNLIERLLTRDILDEMQKAMPYNNLFDGVESDSYIYANYFINRKITELERKQYLTSVAANYKLKLYTRDRNAVIPGAENIGPVDYYKEMFAIFANTKVNLNISLRSITSGIPLRCMDIMAAGGFLLTNYQADFLRHFEPGVDFVYYENEEDMLEKIGYYLEHDEERMEIAKNGQEKVRREHSFYAHFKEILEFVCDDRTIYE